MNTTPTFDGLCEAVRATQSEREALAHHLAGIRYRETLKLIDHPIARAAKASNPNASDEPRPLGAVGSGRLFDGPEKDSRK